MALNPDVKKRWMELQRKFPVPVNAIGVPIDEKKDAMMYKVWIAEGINEAFAPGGVKS